MTKNDKEDDKKRKGKTKKKSAEVSKGILYKNKLVKKLMEKRLFLPDDVTQVRIFVPEDVNEELEVILEEIDGLCEEAIGCWNSKREKLCNCAVNREIDAIDSKLLDIDIKIKELSKRADVIIEKIRKQKGY